LSLAFFVIQLILLRKAEGRRQRAEGRGQRAEGRRQRAEGRRQLVSLFQSHIFKREFLGVSYVPTSAF